jgi:hypothetical protein
LRGQNLYNDETIVKVSMLFLGWEGPLAATLLSVVIPVFSGKLKLMEQNACGTTSEHLPLHLCFFLVAVMDRNAVCFGTVEW